MINNFIKIYYRMLTFYKWNCACPLSSRGWNIAVWLQFHPGIEVS